MGLDGASRGGGYFPGRGFEGGDVSGPSTCDETRLLGMHTNSGRASSCRGSVRGDDGGKGESDMGREADHA